MTHRGSRLPQRPRGPHPSLLPSRALLPLGAVQPGEAAVPLDARQAGHPGESSRSWGPRRSRLPSLAVLASLSLQQIKDNSQGSAVYSSPERLSMQWNSNMAADTAVRYLRPCPAGRAAPSARPAPVAPPGPARRARRVCPGSPAARRVPRVLGAREAPLAPLVPGGSGRGPGS